MAGLARRASGSGAPALRGAAVMDHLHFSCQVLPILANLQPKHSAGQPRHGQLLEFLMVGLSLFLQYRAHGVLFFGLVLGVVLSSLLDGPQTGPTKI